jgi:hypothetical protein
MLSVNELRATHKQRLREFTFSMFPSHIFVDYAVDQRRMSHHDVDQIVNSSQALLMSNSGFLSSEPPGPGRMPQKIRQVRMYAEKLQGRQRSTSRTVGAEECVNQAQSDGIIRDVEETSQLARQVKATSCRSVHLFDDDSDEDEGRALLRSVSEMATSAAGNSRRQNPINKLPTDEAKSSPVVVPQVLSTSKSAADRVTTNVGAENDGPARCEELRGGSSAVVESEKAQRHHSGNDNNARKPAIVAAAEAASSSTGAASLNSSHGGGGGGGPWPLLMPPRQRETVTMTTATSLSGCRNNTIMSFSPLLEERVAMTRLMLAQTATSGASSGTVPTIIRRTHPVDNPDDAVPDQKKVLRETIARLSSRVSRHTASLVVKDASASAEVAAGGHAPCQAAEPTTLVCSVSQIQRVIQREESARRGLGRSERLAKYSFVDGNGNALHVESLPTAVSEVSGRTCQINATPTVDHTDMIGNVVNKLQPPPIPVITQGASSGLGRTVGRRTQSTSANNAVAVRRTPTVLAHLEEERARFAAVAPNLRVASALDRMTLTLPVTLSAPQSRASTPQLRLRSAMSS